MLIYCASNNTDTETRQKLESLIQDISNRKEPVGIPAPAWAEYLVKAESATPEIMKNILGKKAIKILPFGPAEAIETAEIGRQLAKPEEENWQQVKYDRQILATAKTQNARVVYSDDRRIIREATLLNITVNELKNLPLPPQQELDFTSDNTQNRL